MRGRLAAYGCYAGGSCVFLVTAVSRGSVLVGLGSALFLVGTLLLAGLELRRAVRQRRPTRSGASRSGPPVRPEPLRSRYPSSR